MVSDGIPVWDAIAARSVPGGRFVRAWSFAGGLSSSMTVLDVDVPGAIRQRLVVRRARPDAGRRAPSIAREYRLVEKLSAGGLAVPVPVLLDESCDVLAQPYAVYRYVEGAPQLSSTDPASMGEVFANLLAAIHRIDPGIFADLALPHREDLIERRLAVPPDVLDDSLREGLVRAVLVEHRRLWMTGSHRLLHGDLWPGNVLFDRGSVAAIIDWQSAALGNPLADVAVTRLDLLWAYGPEAMATFTNHYLAITDTDASTLAIWDLVASLRPAGEVSSWAADWSNFGRPEVTARYLRAGHARFVDQALAALRKA
jgi:aminoglycoside phosphotransferase (APT) family kinase protein